MMAVFGVALIGMNTATHRPVLVLHELGALPSVRGNVHPNHVDQGRGHNHWKCHGRYFQSASIVSQASLRDRGKRRKRPSSMALSRRVVHRAVPEPRRLSGAAIGETR